MAAGVGRGATSPCDPLRSFKRNCRLDGVRTRTRVLASGRILGNVHLTNGPLAYILRNRMYLGEINHRGKSFLAEHEPIIEKEV